MAPACEACRNLKMRCSRSGCSEDAIHNKQPCDRCKRHGRPCNVPSPRPSGRKPGSLGRYRGVEKALRNIQAELRKAQNSSSNSGTNQLKDLPEDSQELLDLLVTNTISQPQNVPIDSRPDESQTRTSTPPTAQPSSQAIPPPRDLSLRACPGEDQTTNAQSENNGTISNPLGLVADAWGEAQAFDRSPNTTMTLLSPDSGANQRLPNSSPLERFSMAQDLLATSSQICIGRNLDRSTLEHGLSTLLGDEVRTCQYQDYFKRSDVTEDRDTGPEIDPVDLGLVSMEEAHYLFPLFFQRLLPINGILDPMLHTPEFVRARSALLFTWILAISAQYDHNSGLVSKRLRIHGEHLSRHVHAKGYKSVEIVQGYYISLLSAAPANTLAEERSWLYTIHAFGVAAELGLDRNVRSSRSSIPMHARQNRSQLTSRHVSEAQFSAAPSDDNRDLPEDPVHVERLARNRERTWLRMLLWERAHSAARGRVSAFPETDLTRNIESWSLHYLADPHDKYTCAFILLRRHLGSLNEQLKRQLNFPHTSRHWVQELCDSTLQPWCATWLQRPGPSMTLTQRVSTTFLRYVYLHGRLWTLSFALYGRNGESHDVGAIKEDCFEAAVEACEVVVQDLQEIGEPLYCMMAPTWAMISYTAVLAMRLFPLLYSGQVNREIELLSLLTQVALQLERAGTTPSHRFGIAALLGQHLFMILRTKLERILSNLPPHTTLATRSQDRMPSDASCGDSAPSEHFSGAPGQLDFPQNSFDPFSSAFDPFLTLPLLPGEEDGTTDGFAGVLWDWAGQGFGSFT